MPKRPRSIPVSLASFTEYLHRCLVYIDLNMVRAGVVRHPAQWAHGGYREIQRPPERYALIDMAELSTLCGFEEVASFQRAHRQWVEEALRRDVLKRDERWTEAIAVGSQTFIAKIQRDLGMKARHRNIDAAGETCALREPRGKGPGAIQVGLAASNSFSLRVRLP